MAPPEAAQGTESAASGAGPAQGAGALQGGPPRALSSRNRLGRVGGVDSFREVTWVEHPQPGDHALKPATSTAQEREHGRAFRALFEAELGFVHRVLRRHGVSERDLPDVCQETFLVVHRRLPEFEGRSSLRTWIYGIAVRVAASQRRKAHVRRERLDVALPEPSMAPLELATAEQNQLLSRVEAALSSTSEERREVFVLYELEGLTMREVAEALSVPENTALSRLYRAREDIRAHVARRERTTPRAAGGTR